MEGPFFTELAENVYGFKYANDSDWDWYTNTSALVQEVSEGNLTDDEEHDIREAINDMKFMPGGRYIYYAGRSANFWNNCFLLAGEEDTREEWAALMQRSTSCLMTGGGIGIDYSIFRPAGAYLGRTGGEASGPIPLMHAINEIGRNVKQGGSRRSAIYASLNWSHGDTDAFLHAKDWDEMEIGHTGHTLWHAKQDDFDFPAPLDMTNISINYDDEFLNYITNNKSLPNIFLENVKQAMRTGEPGFSFNFGSKEEDTLRNACTEVTSADDSDCCNLGSVNMARIKDIDEFRRVVRAGSKFLVAGTLTGDLPYDKVREVRDKNRRLGLGLMGIHEWLISRGYGYEVVDELHEWLAVYAEESERAANEVCDRLGISRPVAYRAIAPTGTIGILASTTTGIEPLFAVAYKRRYLEGTKWKYMYVVDNTAKLMAERYGIDPNSIETAASLAQNPERRIKFQADIQDYVDMSISSTLNLPEWGSEVNNENKVEEMAWIIAKYSPRLRGLTFYPDGARGGQPITEVDYETAMQHEGTVFEENQELQCNSGICGV